MNELDHASFAETYLSAYLQPLADLLEDPAVIEIAINAGGEVWVERAGDAHMIGIGIRDLNVVQLARQIIGDSRGSLSERSPIGSAKMQWRDLVLRAQIVLPPAVDRGPALSFRKFFARSYGIAAFDYLYGRAFDAEAARSAIRSEISDLARAGRVQDALRLAVRERLNVVISGGTSTAKTTLARAMIAEIPHVERLVTIEDAVELYPGQPNVVSLVAERTPGSARNTNELLRATLRLRPDRIILGELRGNEAYTFLEAINTGHGGSMTTIHADTAHRAIERLSMLVIESGIALPYSEIERYVRSTIDLIVQLGRVDGKRGILGLELPSTMPRTREAISDQGSANP